MKGTTVGSTVENVYRNKYVEILDSFRFQLLQLIAAGQRNSDCPEDVLEASWTAARRIDIDLELFRPTEDTARLASRTTGDERRVIDRILAARKRQLDEYDRATSHIAAAGKAATRIAERFGLSEADLEIERLR